VEKKMADKTFDVVIVGGGNKGLVTAMYLAKYGGMEVGIFESHHELGGGWSTVERAAPGFLGPPHSAVHAVFYHPTLSWDFPGFEEMATWIPDEIAYAAIFRDKDMACVCGYNFIDYDPDQTKTATSIARYSQKDADTWLYWWKIFKEKVWPAFLKVWNVPQTPWGVPNCLEQVLMDPATGIPPWWGTYPPLRVARDLFESKITQSWALRGPQALAGLDLTCVGNGGMFFLALYAALSYGYIKGGSHSMAHAAHRVIKDNGGKTFTKHKVAKIIIENGKATGIRLTDGSEIEARKLVITNVSPQQLLEMVGEKYFDPRIVRQVKHLDNLQPVFAQTVWALNELPHYTAAQTCPDIDRVAGFLSMVRADPEAVVMELARTRAGLPPDSEDLDFGTYCASMHDPTMAPEGKHTVHDQILTPLPADKLTEREWMAFKKKYAEDALRHWHKHAPNMTWDNVIGYATTTPYDVAALENYAPSGGLSVLSNIPDQLGRMRPIPEWCNHRIPELGNLYATGSGWPAAGCASSTQGYVCYKIIAEDLHLQKPWEVDGRPF
jgi:beta-carotene ketolase (CrtO type)